MPSSGLLIQKETPSPAQAKRRDSGAGSKRISQATRKTNGNRKPGKPQDALLCDMDLPICHTFYPLGFAVEILTNDPDVFAAANDSFGHRRLCRGRAALQIRIGVSAGGSSKCPPEPTRREYNHLYSLVADGDNQALLDLRARVSFVWVKKATLNNRLYFRYNFLEKVVYLLLGASVVTDVHAACVSRNGKGILLCGDSGAGKSTLAYACARDGWTYTSDDTCYLVNDSEIPRVIGHSHRVRFRPEARMLFPELRDHNVTPRIEGKPSIEVRISDLPELHIRTAHEANVHSIVYLKRYSVATARLRTLPVGAATTRASQELFSAGEIREKHEAILRILSDVPTYELYYRNLHDAMQKLELLI